MTTSQAKERAEQVILLVCAGEVTTEEAISIFASALEQYATERADEKLEEAAKIADGEAEFFREQLQGLPGDGGHLGSGYSGSMDTAMSIARDIRSLKSTKESTP